MRDILGTDLKLNDEFDLSIADGDIELVTGTDCLKQDLSHALVAPLFFWGLSMSFGSRLTQFVNGASDSLYLAELRRVIREVFDNEPRVVPDSLKMEVYHRFEKIEVELEFLPIDRATPESMTFIIDNVPGS